MAHIFVSLFPLFIYISCTTPHCIPVGVGRCVCRPGRTLRDSVCCCCRPEARRRPVEAPARYGDRGSFGWVESCVSCVHRYPPGWVHRYPPGWVHRYPPCCVNTHAWLKLPCCFVNRHAGLKFLVVNWHTKQKFSVVWIWATPRENLSLGVCDQVWLKPACWAT